MCSIQDCSRVHHAHGLCQNHYRRWRLYGDPLAGRIYGDDSLRFWSKVDKDGDCWIWTAGRTKEGYGRFSAGSDQLAHRYSYEVGVGPIPKGMTLDHLCRNVSCVRPSHLEPVPIGVNVLRGEAPSAKFKRQTHCLRGHEFTPENTRYERTPYGFARKCRRCRADRQSRVRKGLL